MARRCVVCDKGTVSGNKISHSNRKSRRRWNANLQRIRINWKGVASRQYVCTRCLKGGKVSRVI